MNKPLVAIVGRPNVGKSTFFNKITGKRISIVEDVPGVTRDRIHADAEWLGHEFTLIDTGGIDPHSEDLLLSQMRMQAQTAIDLADVICFFTDAREGLTEDDKDVADLLRRAGKPVLLVVNKVDYLGTCLDSAICWIRLSAVSPKMILLLIKKNRLLFRWLLWDGRTLARVP